MVLDQVLKKKLSSLWVSVRKAFLDIDDDKDGYIEPADIMRFFGDDDPVEMVDLQKLMKEKMLKDPSKGNSNSREGGKARLTCQDFTSWVGESIHRREGFYFRHDSMKNPRYHQHVQKQEEIMKENHASS